MPRALSVAPFRDALEVARTATFSISEWDAYDRAKMTEQDARGALVVACAEGEARGLVAGEARAKRDAILRPLARRGLAIDDAAAARLAACTDLGTLDRWFESSVDARTIAEVFASQATFVHGGGRRARRRVTRIDGGAPVA